MRISDWSSDVCSSDLRSTQARKSALLSSEGINVLPVAYFRREAESRSPSPALRLPRRRGAPPRLVSRRSGAGHARRPFRHGRRDSRADTRSEEHTSELQSLMHISYAVFCLKKKTTTHTKQLH